MMEPQATHDTWLSPVLFRDGSDRRDGARIPKALKVRLGPPKAPPETTLLSEDLSTGGLFVRCAEPVQVGARFSLEIALDSGEAVYIPEAEVLYNYAAEDGQKRGFGARFVSVTKEAHEKLVEAARFSSDLRVVKDQEESPEVSESMILEQDSEHLTSRVRKGGIDLKNAVPVGPRVSDLRLATERPRHISAIISLRPDMVINRGSSAWSGAIAPVGELPAPPPAAAHDVAAHDVALDADGAIRDTLIPEAVSDEPVAPSISASGTPEPAELETPSHITVSAISDMHAGISALPREVRERRQPGLLDSLTERIGQKPLLWVSGTALFMGACMFALVHAKRDPAARPAVVSKIPAADLAALERAAQPVRAMEPTKPGVAEKAAEAKAPAAPVVVEPKKAAPAPVTPEAAPAPKAEPKAVIKAEAKPTTLEALDRAVSKVGPAVAAASGSMSFTVDEGAKVLRTHVLKAPNRFVVDVSGMKSAPSVKESGELGAPRVGKHEDYWRIVLDTPYRIEKGEASISGSKLSVRVQRSSK